MAGAAFVSRLLVDYIVKLVIIVLILNPMHNIAAYIIAFCSCSRRTKYAAAALRTSGCVL